ncbi:hypothetical protein [Raoultella terrigena]|uniref:hypothetical protein n=2 Tax=Raoultella terrigena TaxID=577 RepID=UPI003BAB1794
MAQNPHPGRSVGGAPAVVCPTRRAYSSLSPGCGFSALRWAHKETTYHLEPVVSESNYSLGMFVGPVIMGLMLQHINLSSGYLLIAALSVVAARITPLSVRWVNNRQIDASSQLSDNARLASAREFQRWSAIRPAIDAAALRNGVFFSYLLSGRCRSAFDSLRPSRY